MNEKLAVIALILVFGFAGWWEIYRYKDCKKVGHTALYCLFSK